MVSGGEDAGMTCPVSFSTGQAGARAPNDQPRRWLNAEPVAPRAPAALVK